MNDVRLGRPAIAALAAIGLLAGCGGAQNTLSVARSSVVPGAARVSHGTSWMLPEAKGEDLIYVTNGQTVQVFTYPSGKPAGELKGFNSASGACVDAKGNVFITDWEPVGIFEYPHGGTKRIATYRLKEVAPFGCAVDPTTGNLAATGGSSDVDIFKPGRRNPLIINDPNMFFNYFCVYDSTGNLYVDGSRNAKGKPIVSELPVGAKFGVLNLNAPVDTVTNLEWDGEHLIALSYGPPPLKSVHPKIIQFDIKGYEGSKVGTVILDRPAYSVVNYTLVKDTLLLSNWQGKKGKYERTLLLVPYPIGGKPRTQITGGLTIPRGVVVSFAYPTS